MFNRIIIAPYPFKGVLGGQDVAAEVSATCSERFPHASLREVPLGDGGTGTLDALVGAYGGALRTAMCTDATGRQASCRWGLLDDGRGVIESAEVISLASVPPWQRNPARLTTRGLGELLLHIVREGVTDLLIGLGDTATHDCGIGMAAAIGYRFLDGRGRSIEPVGASLSEISRIDPEGATPLLLRLVPLVLCDVLNPLVGPDGAALGFASQKGADPVTVARLERGSEHWMKIVKRDIGLNPGDLPGSGAAGGLGGGFAAFVGGRLIGGADAVADAVDLERLIAGSDLVITAEGRVDRKTMLGKGVARVARMAGDAGVQCLVIAGSVEGEREDLERRLSAAIIDCGEGHRGRPTPVEARRRLREKLRTWRG